jgi:hypothetical protein
MLSPLLLKEVRALAPVFFGTAAFVVACSVSTIRPVAFLGPIAYVAGTIALGSLAIGHEYSYDTLGQILAQPGARRRLVRLKMIALLACLVTLTMVGTLALNRVSGMFGTGADTLSRSAWQATMLLLPPMLAFSVAPWLSVKCESPLAASIFSLAVYALFWTMVRFAMPLSTSAPGQFLLARTVLTSAALTVAAFASVGAWRAFLRAETKGHHQGTVVESVVTTVSTQTSRPARIGRPVPALVIKELRLQRPAFVVGALFVIGWTVVNVTARNPSEAGAVFGGITMLYRGLIAVLTGVLASAEERAAGTLPLQTLQPYQASRQWAIKVGIAVTLTLLLGGALPSLLDAAYPSVSGSTWFGVSLAIPRLSMNVNGFSGFYPHINLATGSPVGLLLLLSVAALYVSTMCRTTLSALLLSIPFTSALVAGSYALTSASAENTASGLDLPALFARFGRLALREQTERLTYADSEWRWAMTLAANWWWIHMPATTLIVHAVIAVAWLAPLLVFGLRNHRRSLIEPHFLVRQIGRFALWTAACAIAAGAFGPLQIWFLAKPWP